MIIFSKSIFIIVIFLTGLLLNSCDDKFKADNTDVNSSDVPSQESWNSTVIFSDSGKTRAVLTAGHISVYSTRGYTLLDSGTKVDFYKDNVKVSTLSGKRGKVDDKTKDIEVYDSVKAVNNDGNELTTNKLFWNNKLQKVSSDEFVRIKTPGETIEGIGFESDQNLKNYRIFKVSGTFTN